MIKIIIESSHEHVDAYKILFLFNKTLKSYGLLYFTTFCMKLILRALELYMAIQKGRAAQFLTTFNKFSLQHLLNHKWYVLFLEGCLKIPKLLPGSQKRHICNNIEINTLFAIFNNKGLENIKVRPNHTILKGMDAG